MSVSPASTKALPTDPPSSETNQPGFRVKRGRVQSLIAVCRLAVIGALVTAAGCADSDFMNKLLGRTANAPRWARDSVLLAGEPEVLFRVLADPGGAFVVPLGTISNQGFRALKLGNEGWRRMDRTYLHSGRTLVTHRNGQPAAQLRMFRGMWEPANRPLDTLRGCAVVIPIARAITAGGAAGELAPPFASNRERPPLPSVPTLSRAEIDEALANIGTLVAPGAGISSSQLPRYTRTVHQVPSGVNDASSIVVEYDDPTPLPDSVRPFGERPRQFIVVLDKGLYGYKPTYTFATLGGNAGVPKLRYLDYMDLDNDGMPELMFGLADPRPSPLFTIVLRSENGVWREIYRNFGGRCDY